MEWRFWENKATRVTRKAARLHVEMDEPESQAQVDAFQAWLAADPTHERAYGQIERIAAVARLTGAPHSTASDISLTDIEMPGLTGIDVARALAEAGSAGRTVVVTTFARPGYLVRVRAAGVRG